jgi:hypothetical protein
MRELQDDVLVEGWGVNTVATTVVMAEILPRLHTYIKGEAKESLPIQDPLLVEAPDEAVRHRKRIGAQ